MSEHGIEIDSYPIHLGLGAKAFAQPRFTGELSWYEAYMHRHAADGGEGRLVALHSFDRPWESWEMHPAGDEVVLCISGTMTLHQEHPDGTRTRVVLGAGQYTVNAPGVWHTADVEGSTTALFITAGWGTKHRPR